MTLRTKRNKKVKQSTRKRRGAKERPHGWREFAKAYKEITGREPKWWGTGIMAFRLWTTAQLLAAVKCVKAYEADAARRNPDPRKCTWGDPVGGCQGHPDDCHCQPAVAAEPEALTAAYERGWNAGYKSGKPVPQGMVLVPVEAPDEMLAAGAKTLSLYRDDMVSDATIADNIYRAMLAARSNGGPSGR